MHASVRMTDYPIEFLNITPVNPLISKCQIKVCYVGQEPNRNGSIITKEVATEMANSLPGSPIVGYFNKKDGDFEEHNRDFEIIDGELQIEDATKPYGFVDLNAKVWFAKYLDDDSMEHEYLMTEGWLWTGQYPEAKRILENGNNQSMELDESHTSGKWTKSDNGYPEFFIINETIISKLCILGQNYEPCFEGANITTPTVQFSLGKRFEERLFAMMDELKKYLDEGGSTMENLDEKNLENQDKLNQLDDNNNDNTLEVTENPEVEEVEVNENNSSTEENELIENNQDEIHEEPEQEESPNVEEPVVEEPQSYNLDEIPEYVDLKAKYEELQSQFTALQTDKDNLEEEINPLREFKLKADKTEKEKMINGFYMLSDEDKEDVIKNIDTYSLDDIESKLSVLCVRKKVNFKLDEEQEQVTTFNLDSQEDEDDLPDWVKRVMEVEKELN